MDTMMRIFVARRRVLGVVALLAVAGFVLSAHGAELKVSREARERTLVQQLFGGPEGRYYLKGSAKSSCSVYAEKPEVSFDGERVLVKVKVHAERAVPGVESRSFGGGIAGPGCGRRDDRVSRCAHRARERVEGAEFPADAVSESSDSIKYESECGGYAAQGAGGIDADDRL